MKIKSFIDKLYLDTEMSKAMKFILILFTIIQIAVTGILTFTVFELKNKIEVQTTIKPDDKVGAFATEPATKEIDEDYDKDKEESAFFRFINKDTIIIWK